MKRALNLLHHKTPLSDIKLQIKDFILNIWQESWDLELNNKLHHVKPTIMTWAPNYPRKTVLTRLRIGHSRIINKHPLFWEDSPMC